MKRLLRTSLIVTCISWSQSSHGSELAFMLGGSQEEQGQFDLCLLLSKTRAGAKHLESYKLVDPKSGREMTFGFALVGEEKKVVPASSKPDAPSTSSSSSSTTSEVKETQDVPELASYFLPTGLSTTKLGYLPSLADNGDELKVFETFLHALQVKLMGQVATQSHEAKIQGATFHMALKSTKKLEPLLETGEETYFQGRSVTAERAKRQRTHHEPSSSASSQPTDPCDEHAPSTSVGRAPFTRENFLDAIFLEEKRKMDEQRDLAQAMSLRDIRFEQFFLPPVPKVGTSYLSLFYSSRVLPEAISQDSWTMDHCRKVCEDDPSMSLEQFKEWFGARMGAYFKKYVEGKPTGMHG